jgi:hypothetical protein
MTIIWDIGQPLDILERLKDDWKFREGWWRAEGIPGSYTRLNAAKLWEYAHHVPIGGTIVELGVDRGRSASIILASIETTNADFYLIDSWESILIENRRKVEKLLGEFSRLANYHIVQAKSTPPPEWFQLGIDLLHIDADHYLGGVDKDCEAWLPQVKHGGVALFHDYGSTFPVVTQSVDKYTVGWEDLGNWDSLAIRRKP